MERKRLLLIGGLALGLAFLVSAGTYRLLSATVASGRGTQTSVVVAAADLGVGARVAESDLRLVKLPDGDLPDGVYHSTSEIAGRGIILPISKNEIVTTKKVAAENSGAGLPSLITPGMRAVSVKVNDVVAVAGFAVPGTRVDVLLTGNPDKTGSPEKVTTTTVLSNVQVLAAGQKLEHSPDGKPETVPVITLLVSPEDAERLTLASQEGRIQLALRNPLDVDLKSPHSVQHAALYGVTAPAPARRKKAAVGKPEPPPSTIFVVEMIRGNKRDETKF